MQALRTERVPFLLGGRAAFFRLHKVELGVEMQEIKSIRQFNGKCWLEVASTLSLRTEGWSPENLPSRCYKFTIMNRKQKVAKDGCDWLLTKLWCTAAGKAPAGKRHSMYCYRSYNGKWTLTASVASGLIIVSTSKQVWLCFTSKCICPCCVEVRRWVQIHRAQSNADSDVLRS